MFYIILLLAILLSGCSSSTMNINPTTADIHELFFQYKKADKYYSAIGHASTVINAGGKRALRVLIPKSATGQLLILDEGDNHINKTIDGQRWVDIELDPMPSNRQTSTVGLALATRNYGVITGRLYIIGNLNITDTMNVDFQCPYKMDNGSVASCTRPEGFNFYVTVNITNNQPGKMRVSPAGVCSHDTMYYDIPGKGTYHLKFTSLGKGYCNIRIDLRQDLVNDQWQIQQFKEINVNYYDPSYIPLTPPILSGTPGNWIITATENYKDTNINGISNGSLSKGKSIKVQTKSVTFIAWDQYGRLTWISSSKMNEFAIYRTLRPYVINKYIRYGITNIRSIIKDPYIKYIMERI